MIYFIFQVYMIHIFNILHNKFIRIPIKNLKDRGKAYKRMTRPIKVILRFRENGKKALGILPQGPDMQSWRTSDKPHLSIQRYHSQSPSLIKDFQPSYFHLYVIRLELQA